MDAIIEKFGLIIFAFFFMSMAVETILEGFRGILLRFGIVTLQSKGTLNDALEAMAEFVPEGSKSYAKFAALAEMVQKKVPVAVENTKKVESLLGELKTALNPQDRAELVEKDSAWLSALAAPIRADMERNESKRVLYLRFISAGLGVAIAAVANIDLAKVMNFADQEGTWAGMVSYLAFGLASAGGSSYWHDWLDRVRKLKEVSAGLAALKA